MTFERWMILILGVVTVGLFALVSIFGIRTVSEVDLIAALFFYVVPILAIINISIIYWVIRGRGDNTGEALGLFILLIVFNIIIIVHSSLIMLHYQDIHYVLRSLTVNYNLSADYISNIYKNVIGQTGTTDDIIKYLKIFTRRSNILFRATIISTLVVTLYFLIVLIQVAFVKGSNWKKWFSFLSSRDSNGLSRVAGSHVLLLLFTFLSIGVAFGQLYYQKYLVHRMQSVQTFLTSQSGLLLGMNKEVKPFARQYDYTSIWSQYNYDRITPEFLIENGFKLHWELSIPGDIYLPESDLTVTRRRMQSDFGDYADDLIMKEYSAKNRAIMMFFDDEGNNKEIHYTNKVVPLADVLIKNLSTLYNTAMIKRALSWKKQDVDLAEMDKIYSRINNDENFTYTGMIKDGMVKTIYSDSTYKLSDIKRDGMLILYGVGNNIENSFHYIDMLYFSMITITTTGYGDIQPNSATIKGLVTIENVIEVLFLTLYFGILLAFKPEEDSNPVAASDTSTAPPDHPARETEVENE